MARDALIIDLDGTLWDSAPWYAALVARDPTEAAALALTLRTPGAGQPAASLIRDRLGSTRFDRICRERIDDLHLYPGANRTLEHVAQTHCTLAVLTSLPSWVARPMLENLGLSELFVTLCTARRGLRPKPHPAGLRHLLGELNLAPHRAVFLGDTAADALAAEAAQVPFLWAGWGYAEAIPSQADAVQNWEEVPALL